MTTDNSNRVYGGLRSLVPVIYLLIFMAIVYAFSVWGIKAFKEPENNALNVKYQLEQVDKMIANQDWNGAMNYALGTEQAFSNRMKILVFNVDGPDMTEFERDLARLKAAIETEDLKSGRQLIQKLLVIWDNMANL